MSAAPTVNQRANAEPQNWNSESVYDVEQPTLVHVCISSQADKSAPDKDYRQIRQTHELDARGRVAVYVTKVPLFYFDWQSLVR